MAFRVTWRGTSQQTYSFETYPIGTSFRAVPGVYIACKPVSPGRWSALYVGETSSLRERINDQRSAHDGLARARSMGATHIGVLHVPARASRLRVETDLRHSLRPPANLQNNRMGV